MEEIKERLEDILKKDVDLINLDNTQDGIRYMFFGTPTKNSLMNLKI